MVALLFPDATWLGDAGERFEAAEAWAWLAGQREPVFLAATALALATLLEEPGSCRLAPGSALMTTGGAKGRRLELEPRALVARATDRLGPALRLVGEYGMTELSSQLWTPAALAGSSEAPTPEGPFLPPPWLVPLAVDPADGSPLPAGRAGQLRFVDLANDHSVLAIETMDQGTVLSGGALLLHGRLPGAEPRGCSLTAEDALAAALAARR
jgi:acyl-CoA synthetase (AMP-forming)/AMP-acid ligase II